MDGLLENDSNGEGDERGWVVKRGGDVKKEKCGENLKTMMN